MSAFLLPHFVGIGGHRCGSSWLWKNLRCHPDIWTPNAKELHFFDRKLNKRLPRIFLKSETLQAVYYRRYFLKSFLRASIRRGEFTPAYSILPPNEISKISRMLPKLKLLYSMRSPVDRAWSHVRKDFQLISGKTVEAASTDEIIEFLKRPEVESRCDYAASLRNWLSVYPRDQLHICFYEEIASDPKSLLARAWRFIGVSGDLTENMQFLAEKVNSRPSSPIPDSVSDYLSEKYKNQSFLVEQHSGIQPPW